MAEKESRAEQCHNEIAETLVKYKLSAFEIVAILEMIKSDIVRQVCDRFYIFKGDLKPKPLGKPRLDKKK